MERRTMDLVERRTADARLLTDRQNARRDYTKHAEAAADADRDYERERARVFLEEKADGATDMKADRSSRSAAADFKRTRDVELSLARAALLKIDETEREAVTIRDVHASSERVEGLTA